MEGLLFLFFFFLLSRRYNNTGIRQYVVMVGLDNFNNNNGEGRKDCLFCLFGYLSTGIVIIYSPSTMIE